MPIDPDALYDFPATPYTGVGKTKGYEEVNAGKLRITKVGSRSKLTGAEILRYRATCPTVGGGEGQSDEPEV